MNYHNVIIARNGEFVGLYRRDGDTMRLWRCVIDKPYGKTSELYRRKEPKEWGSGGHLGISGEWACNEMHRIPKGYNLNDRKHLLMLDSLLGRSHAQTRRLIESCNPRPGNKSPF